MWISHVECFFLYTQSDVVPRYRRFKLLEGRKESVEGAAGSGAGASPVAGELHVPVVAQKQYKRIYSEKGAILRP